MGERLAMFHRVRRALDGTHFRLVFQPIIDLAEDEPRLHELLLRMVEGEALLAPGEFLPVAEHFSLMGEIDRWVIRHAIPRNAASRHQNPGMAYTINLSARAFADHPLLQEIRRLLEEHRLEPGALVFEITETEAIANLSEAKDMIWNLRDLGCRFSQDDFGSGFASFAYLRELPVDMVKIDGKFIRELDTSPLDQAIVRALVGIAQFLGKEVVAEFVEDAKTRDLLQRIGVHYGQGFFLGHPTLEPRLPSSPRTEYRGRCDTP